MTEVRAGYRRMEGSERRPAPGARRIGSADPGETVVVSVYVRPPIDAPPLPDIHHWMSPRPHAREFLSHDEFARTYGAVQVDLDKVSGFARANGLKREEVNSARRVVVLSGTVTQMNRAFGVDLGQYESNEETYRGREGHVHLPNDLADIAEGVFGLDDRRVGRPHVVVTATPPQVANQYGFPSGGGIGQTIGILEFGGGFSTSDLNASFAAMGVLAPTVTVVPIPPGANTPAGNASSIPSQNPDLEVMIDICIAGGAIPGPAIVVYFAQQSMKGWVDALTYAITDATNNPSVLSVSWAGDEGASFTVDARNKISDALRSAAALGVTVLAITGDTGSTSGTIDGKAHVAYPASDTWATACGGTVIQSLTPPFSDVTWNDASGATGGGISSAFVVPPYQVEVPGIPPSVNDGVSTGRGIPDLAGNAGGNGGGYDLILYGTKFSLLTITTGASAGKPAGPIAGTSAVAPLYAGLIATLNGILGRRIGFLNPMLYLIAQTPWLRVFRDINDGVGNSVNGAPGYFSGPGWDACTGWGVPDGSKLGHALIQGRLTNPVDSTPYAPAACVGVDIALPPGMRMFWRANDRSGAIYTSFSTSGFDFPNGTPINGIDKTSKSPAACLFNNRVFVFWKSRDASNAIYVSASDTGTWPPGVTVNSSDHTPDSPAVCVFLQQIFLFWKSNDSSNEIHFSSSPNGFRFPPGTKINSYDHTTSAPSACVFNNQIFLFWKAEDGSNAIYFTASDGVKFPQGRRINLVDRTPVSPAACTFDNKLFLFWKSNDGNSIYWSASADGAYWPAGQKIDYADSTPDSPVPAVLDKSMYLYWKADDETNRIYGVSWPVSLFK